MATETLPQGANLAAANDQRVIPAGVKYKIARYPDGTYDLLTPEEDEFIRMYREADDAGKRRLDKILHAAGKGLLPSVEESNAMTLEQRHAFADALPEVA